MPVNGRQMWAIFWLGLSTAPALAQTPSPAALIREVRQHVSQRRFDRAALPLYQRALRVAEAAHNDTLRGLAAYAAGRSYYTLSRLDSAAGLLRLAWRSSQRAHDLVQVVNAGNFLNLTYGSQGQADSARLVMGRLRALYPRTQPGTAARAKLDDVLAGDCQDQGQYARALTYRLAALAYYRQQLDTARIGVSLVNISEVFYLQGQARQSLPYRLEALRWAALTPSLRGTLPQMHEMLGKTYRELAQPDSARQHYETALRLLGPTATTDDPDQTAVIRSEMAAVLADQGLLTLARRQCQQALEAAARSESLDIQAQVYYFAGDVELRASHFALALTYLRRAYALAQKIQSLDRYEPITRLLARAEAGTGHFAEAYQMRDLSAQLLDSAHVGEGQRAMAAMEARYQNQDKQRQIQLLNRENRLQTAEAVGERRAKYLAWAGVAGLLAVVLLIGFLLRQRQRTAALLTRQNTLLDEANQTKAQLFSIISHDLRAPVGSLFQLLELTLDAPDLLDEDARHAQALHLRQSARDLLVTMDELLVWSKNQLNRFDPVRENVALPAVLAELMALYAPLAQHKNIELRLACPPALHRRTDPNFLRVVLRNLLQNALKFTAPGGQVHLEAEAGPGEAVTFRVRDTGPGLAAERLAQLLAPGPAAGPATHPAQGLGLRLTREFVAKLGGTLSATSELGTGSEFTVAV